MSINTNTNTNTDDRNMFALILEEARNPRLTLTYDDPVITMDGSTAEREDCTRVGTNSEPVHSRYSSWDYYTTDQLELAESDGDIHWIESRDEYYEDRICTNCEDGEWHVSHDTIYVHGYGHYHYEDDNLCTDGHGTYFVEGDSDYVWCEDDDNWPRDECHYCDPSSRWIHESEDECDDCGSSKSSGVICRYHSSPDEEMYRGSSPFLIGFEVEKNSVFSCDGEGEEIGERDLFAGWELDGSCGVEGVTHCYDLLDPSIMGMFERHVNAASDVLAEPCDKTCGGHINISWQNHTPRNTLSAFKVYAPLWYALFRGRLNNTYCREDKKIEDRGVKYSPVRCKSFGIELRLPSRVLNAKHLLRRARLIAITCRAMEGDWSFNRFARECRDILLKEAYNGDRKRYAKALRLARHFRIWMLDGVAHTDIYKYIQ